MQIFRRYNFSYRIFRKLYAESKYRRKTLRLIYLNNFSNTRYEITKFTFSFQRSDTFLFSSYHDKILLISKSSNIHNTKSCLISIPRLSLNIFVETWQTRELNTTGYYTRIQQRHHEDDACSGKFSARSIVLTRFLIVPVAERLLQRKLILKSGGMVCTRVSNFFYETLLRKSRNGILRTKFFEMESNGELDRSSKP